MTMTIEELNCWIKMSGGELKFLVQFKDDELKIEADELFRSNTDRVVHLYDPDGKPYNNFENKDDLDYVVVSIKKYQEK